MAMLETIWMHMLRSLGLNKQVFEYCLGREVRSFLLIKESAKMYLVLTVSQELG
jgi:hypothetical protein